MGKWNYLKLPQVLAFRKKVVLDAYKLLEPSPIVEVGPWETPLAPIISPTMFFGIDPLVENNPLILQSNVANVTIEQIPFRSFYLLCAGFDLVDIKLPSWFFLSPYIFLEWATEHTAISSSLSVIQNFWTVPVLATEFSLKTVITSTIPDGYPPYFNRRFELRSIPESPDFRKTG